ncbi:enoyl-CoA hydratase/isomerase family protein [Paraburkholderia xenovorans LB400]|uniref:Short chain enoyl-CoA hydratase n=1 Tax=Paraburkholderia xenovorans (strain LB400) TaxID=266265 RepID=Q143S3_PARXL|nr:enoyl-CoA hydratase [Paraburkholderia xenovorans]ABE29416.1 short chain enoyl-CoA hydratase [Paraburkholderia xenovorans LB400]AIP29877.1 enoyl-CoA hydratase/isomerase family protein [Paraburkholderia xenovorans LB400]
MIEFELSHNGAVAVVTLTRPPANAFTPDGLRQLQQVIRTCDEQLHVRAVVITGSGPKFFSAGADLNTFASGDRDLAREAASAFEAVQNARPVVIAAINGYAMGGGLECALACDIRIAEEHAVLALPETAVGLLPCGCGTQTLPWLVGEGWAKRIILTGERVNAATALRIGLVEDVVARGGAREAALAMAARVASLSPQAVSFSKELIHQGRNGVPREAALAVERERFVDLSGSPDQLEGVNAFLEKRAPRWSTTAESGA